MPTSTSVPSQQATSRQEISCYSVRITVSAIMPSEHVPLLLEYFGLTENGFPKNRNEVTITRGRVTEKRENGGWIVEFTFSEGFEHYFFEALQRFSRDKKLGYHGPTHRALVERDLIVGHINSLRNDLRRNNEWHDEYLPETPKP